MQRRLTVVDGAGTSQIEQADVLDATERTDPKTFVLRRELSEVHLLLDNITSSTEKRLPVLAAGQASSLKDDWLRRVCEIEWPPEGAPPRVAEEAELLIRAKDHLNNMAAPASGLTIAFTHLVAQGDAGIAVAANERIRSNGPSRGSLACAAYPDLVERATCFRKGIRALGWFLFAWLVLTCGASWYIAFGNAALAQRESAQKVLLASQTRLQELAVSAPGDEVTRTVGADSQRREQGGGTVTSVVPRPELACPRTTTQDEPLFSSSGVWQACSGLRLAEASLKSADEQIGRWMRWSTMPSGPAKSDYAVAFAGILGTAILPVLYGILGAGAAVLRSLSQKTRLSLLTPRDLTLAVQQLALGAVMGACIGIFIAQPSTSGEGATVIGPVALSTSALSFLAGFGVDAVFATLESVIARVFNIQPASAARPDAPRA